MIKPNKTSIKKQVQKKDDRKHNNIKVSNQSNSLFINYKWQFSLLIILTLSFIVFYPALFNSFVNWDDDKLIYENPFVVNFSINNLLQIFKSIDKHDPLTIISHGITYKFWNTNPLPYFLFNILLHLVNITLVFQLVKRLSKDYITTIIATTLFAIHPFKSESVAWASERKDLLYSLFYLLALIYYDKFLIKNKWFDYIVAVFLLLLSHLSKFAAITFPIAIILLDYYREKSLNLKVILTKIPFFAISIGFGIIYLTQVGIESPMGTLIGDFAFIDRVFLGCYSFLFYFIEFFVPYLMSPMHPYPIKIDNYLPILYYLASATILISIITAIILFKKVRKINKSYLFGFGFFLVTISLVLHAIPLGGNVVLAERYTYIAYLGLCFIVGVAISNYIQSSNAKNKDFFKLKIIITFAIIIALSVITRQRVLVWNNNYSLYDDVLRKYPKSELAFYNRGLAYLKENKFEESFSDFSNSIAINPNYPNVYNNRANVFYNIGKFKEAIQDCDAALKLDSTFPDAYNTRALAYMKFDEREKVLSDLNKAIKLQPFFTEAYNNRGIALANYKNDLKSAIADFKMAISINDKYAEAFGNLALSYNATDSLNLAIESFNRAIQINPNYSNAYCNRGIVYQRLGKLKEACDDFKMSISLNYQPAQEFINKFCQ